MKNLRDFINIVETNEKTNEGEFASSDRAADAATPFDRNTLGQNIQRGVMQGVRQFIPVGKYTDKNGTEGYDFQPDWNAVGYAQYGDQHVRKINGKWIADDGMAATEPDVVKKLEQQALADMIKSRVTPRGGWKEDNADHQEALANTPAPATRRAPTAQPPAQQTTTVPTQQPAYKEGTTGTYNGRKVIFRSGKWEYM